MLSFIVIGKNEGINLEKCLKSIHKTIENLKIKEYDIIYVDSNSSDNSISVASKYASNVLCISGDVNAAIARNVGAKVAKGHYLVFLDGDMEIQTEFMKVILHSNGSPKFPYVSGDLINVYLDAYRNVISKEFYYKRKLKKDEYLPYTGGFFCIEKWIWESENGMKEKYRRSQDLDFGFRLARKGIFILRKKELAIKHNTISYFDPGRSMTIILKNDYGYRAVLYRDHLFNKNIYKMLFRSDYSFLLLFISSFIAIFSADFVFMLAYTILIIGRSLAQSTSDEVSKFKKLLLLITKDIQMFFSFILFFPSRMKLYKVEKVK